MDNAAEIFGKTLVKLEKPKFSALSLDDVKRAIDNDGEIGTVLLTSPDYFGLCAPLEKIRDYLAEKNIMFFVAFIRNAPKSTAEFHKKDK